MIDLESLPVYFERIASALEALAKRPIVVCEDFGEMTHDQITQVIEPLHEMAGAAPIILINLGGSVPAPAAAT